MNIIDELERLQAENTALKSGSIIPQMQAENERLRRSLDVALKALSDARRDIIQHLQVAKWNLDGQIIADEFTDPPGEPSLIHREGIAASERVVAVIEHAMKIGIGTIGLTPATSGESE